MMDDQPEIGCLSSTNKIPPKLSSTQFWRDFREMVGSEQDLAETTGDVIAGIGFAGVVEDDFGVVIFHQVPDFAT